jgi:hypothetical protein
MTFIQLEKEFIDALSTIYDSQEAKSLTWLSINAASKLERAKYLSMRDEEIPAADLEDRKSVV